MSIDQSAATRQIEFAFRQPVVPTVLTPQFSVRDVTRNFYLPLPEVLESERKIFQLDFSETERALSLLPTRRNVRFIDEAISTLVNYHTESQRAYLEDYPTSPYYIVTTSSRMLTRALVDLGFKQFDPGRHLSYYDFLFWLEFPNLRNIDKNILYFDIAKEFNS